MDEREGSGSSSSTQAPISSMRSVANCWTANLTPEEFKQTAYALDRDSRKASLARFLKRASGGEPAAIEEERWLAA